MTELRKAFYNTYIKCLGTLIQLNITILETVNEDGTFNNERDQNLYNDYHQVIHDLNDFISFAKFLPKEDK